MLFFSLADGTSKQLSEPTDLTVHRPMEDCPKGPGNFLWPSKHEETVQCCAWKSERANRSLGAHGPVKINEHRSGSLEGHIRCHWTGKLSNSNCLQSILQVMA